MVHPNCYIVRVGKTGAVTQVSTRAVNYVLY